VTLTRAGTGVSGITVNWSVTAGGGTLSAPTTVTNDQGQSEVVLTLGPQVGLNSVTANAAGADGSPLTFSATATIPGAFAQVEVRNNSFEPGSVTINTGGTVLWVWAQGSLQHNIVPAPPGTKPSSSAVRNGPTSYEEVFNQAGTYRYFCEVHGTATSGMTGQVVVQ
jgi:plastocyanin